MYEPFEKLRLERGVSVRKVALDTGIPPTAFYEWRSGKSTPKMDKMMKIADYFNVPVEYLQTGKMPDAENKPGWFHDPEVAALAQEMHDRPELQTMFSASRKLSKKDVEAVNRIIESMVKK